MKTCGTRDTLKIARELGIYVHFIDEFNELLGMYTYRPTHFIELQYGGYGSADGMRTRNRA